MTTGVNDSTYTVDTSSTAATYGPVFTPDPTATTCAFTLTIYAKVEGTADSTYAEVGSGAPAFMTKVNTFELSVTETTFASYANPVVYKIWYRYEIT